MGILLFPPVRDYLALGTVQAVGLCIGAGVLLGYISSAAWDVLVVDAGSTE